MFIWFSSYFCLNCAYTICLYPINQYFKVATYPTRISNKFAISLADFYRSYYPSVMNYDKKDKAHLYIPIEKVYNFSL